MANSMKADIKKILISERKLQSIINRLGKQISQDYEGKNLLLVSILKGAVVTMADLMRAITIPCSIDFMVVSSYGAGTESSGMVKIIKDLDVPLADYDVLIVEDILDSGVTLSHLVEFLGSREPRSIRICTLLDKPARRAPGIDLKADYYGFEIEDEVTGKKYAQVSCNLTNFEVAPIYRVCEMVKMEAKRYGVTVTESELIGLCPMKALIDSAEYYLQIKDFDFEKQVLENHIL